jgi:hypothetical protein
VATRDHTKRVTGNRHRAVKSRRRVSRSIRVRKRQQRERRNAIVNAVNADPAPDADHDSGDGVRTPIAPPDLRTRYVHILRNA